VALGVGVTARAGELSCEQTLDGARVREVTQYPATLRYRVTITNTHPSEASEALGVEAALLAPHGWRFTPEAPFRLAVGQAVSADVTLRLPEEAACLALAAADGTEDRAIDNTVTVTWDSGSAVCATRAVCGSLRAPSAPECAPSGGATRELGFWKTRVDAVATCLASGPIDVGLATLTTMAQVEGVLWGSPAKFANGALRTDLERQRFLLARELLVATCNVRVLGAVPPSPDLLSGTRALLAGTDCQALATRATVLERFHGCGLAHEGPVFIKPDPRRAQRIAGDPTVPTGETCAPGTGGR
jgi:hypothetical protein